MSLKTISAAVLLAAGTSGALAVPTTLTGSMFDVTYESTALGLFGSTVSLVGNQLSFFPTSFVAQSGSGIDVTSSTIAVTVTAHAGYDLSSFNLTEGGDYFYFSSTGAPLTAGVSATGQLRVTPLPGVTQSAGIVAGATAANSFLNFNTTNWTAAASVTAPVATTVANVTIQNILAAYTLNDVGYSFIEKKEVFLTVGVTPVPEPETYAMMLAGLAALGFLASRRGS